MITTPITKMETVWNTFQEPRCATYLPNSYMLLMSALDNGWKIARVELAPSWDQHGFVYLVTLKASSHSVTQQIILPKNPWSKACWMKATNFQSPRCPRSSIYSTELIE